ncbi:MAG: MqnA/MqnD/SBP family protein [Acidobacteriota bacterium]
MKREKIRLAHSPDSDDAFMFYALATDKIETDGFNFIHELQDIETLNEAALRGDYEITAVSIHAYAYLHEHYALLNSGASMGEGYGPLVVGRKPFPPEEISGQLIAIPGKKTSAFLALRLFQPDFEYRIVPFDQIISAVERKEVDAGLLIHEGQLSYREHGLFKVLDLGEWWRKTTKLPLPLGGNVIRKDLGQDKIRRISKLLLQSISYALDHREEALNYALQFGRGLSPEQGDRFVSMYVNERTLDYGDDGRQAVQLFLDRGHQAGFIPHSVRVQFV